MIAKPKRVRPNVVDSSAWLAYFADAAGAAHFANAIEAVDHLVVPAVCLLEVFKVVLRQRGESDALQAIALMQQGTVVDLDATLALAAASVGVAHKLPLADSIVYATAQAVGGVVWTQDDDFDGLPDVEYFKPSAGT
ncbi:MAG TPA: type II toxin-antitoxin system VapC family toxin [Gemmatimonadaceae bacterium]|nr:type II toxin-antitoxin system VapC family toxin [Gemmatimonadaceae bacterium]